MNTLGSLTTKACLVYTYFLLLDSFYFFSHTISNDLPTAPLKAIPLVSIIIVLLAILYRLQELYVSLRPLDTIRDLVDSYTGCNYFWFSMGAYGLAMIIWFTPVPVANWFGSALSCLVLSLFFVVFSALLALFMVIKTGMEIQRMSAQHNVDWSQHVLMDRPLAAPVA